MKKKIIGIFVCTLLIATALPVIGMVEDFEKDIENQQVMTCDGPSNSIWFVRGTFRYLDEDEEYLYLKVIYAKLRGFGNGASIYWLFGCSVKFAKPFYGFLPEISLPMPGIGICRQWDYYDMVTYDKLGNGPDLQVGVFGGSILTGFRRVGGVINNNGDDLVYNIEYTLSITGGYDDSINLIKTGSYDELIPSQSIILTTNEIYGFGTVTIELKAISSNTGSAEDTITGFQIGSYTISQPYITAWF